MTPPFVTAGLDNTDFIEFAWSGFEITGLGMLPLSPTVHTLAVISHRLAMYAVWSKGYDKINIISHSWGTTITFDVLSYTSVAVDDWVTEVAPV